MANFPGTNRRFFPGFYFGGSADATDSASANSKWATYLESHKTDWTIAGEVYIGLEASFGWGDFYTDENVRPTDPTDPDDAGYDWSGIDDLLNNTTFLNNGDGKIFIALRDRSADNPHPEWVKASPYNGTWQWTTKSGSLKTGTAYHRASASAELGYFYRAFGTRYAQDDRIAAIKTTEIIRNGQEPTDWNSPTGGGSGGFTGQDAYDQGNISALSNLTTYMPNTVIIKMTNPPRLAYGVQGNPGSIALGMGSGAPDVRMFFTTCGDTGGGAADCDTNTLYWVMQAEADNAPNYMNSELNGWNNFTWPDNNNPWAATGAETITASHYIWYCSSAPRAVADDSGLGQSGTDPAGVIPSHYIGCVIKTDGTGRAFSDWETAIGLFGAQGTQAAPAYPPGYPGPGGAPEPDVGFVRINCGDTSYFDPATGQQWESDAIYTSETGASTLSATLVNGTGYPDALFTKARLDASHDNSLFTITGLENGTYDVVLGFVETFSGATAGFRVFHIDIQGNRVSTDFDIYDQSGGLYTATTKNYLSIVVDAGTMTILLTDTAADRPHISFIEIQQTFVEAQFAAAEETSPGVYADRTVIVSPVMGGQVNIDIDKASVTDWSAVVFEITSKQVGEQVRNVKLRTNI